MAGDNGKGGEWQVVRRRQRYPDNWKTPTSFPQPPAVKLYAPYSQHPSYAQILSRNPNSSTNSNPNSTSNSTPTTTPPNSKPTSPNTPPGTAYYASPHSPTLLRFPPSNNFKEWRGRCFRCCRRGHSIASCRNPIKCGRCWRDGHHGTRCTQRYLNPAAKPFTLAAAYTTEPMFDQMLIGMLPHTPLVMPENRPDTTTCYIDRDEDYFKEIAQLQTQAVVMEMLGLEIEPGVDLVAKLATETGLVQKEELSVGMIGGGKYIIMLPEGLAPTTFMAAVPLTVWQMGISFTSWTPALHGKVSIPTFKVVVNLIGIPVALRREKDVIRAVSSFGLYLGTISQEDPANLVSWTAVVATDHLALIPQHVTMVAGGVNHRVGVHPIKYTEAPVYKEEDIPCPVSFPSPPLPSPTTSSDDEPVNDWEVIPMNRKTLLVLCRGREFHTLPPEIQLFFGPACAMAGDDDQAAGGGEEAHQEQHGMQIVATVDQQHSVELPIATEDQGNEVTQPLTVDK